LSNVDHGGRVHTDLDTLVIALYVKIDETLQDNPSLRPWRPAVGIAPKLSDAELLTLAVAQALLGYVSEARWLRYARATLGHLFPYLPGQSGYNKRLRAAAPVVRRERLDSVKLQGSKRIASHSLATNECESDSRSRLAATLLYEATLTRLSRFRWLAQHDAGARDLGVS
jgi:hypothetical protein